MPFLMLTLTIVAIWSLVAGIATVPTWLLWNWLMPEIFGLPEIGLTQSFGLLLLSSCLFGSRAKFSNTSS